VRYLGVSAVLLEPGTLTLLSDDSTVTDSLTSPPDFVLDAIDAQERTSVLVSRIVARHLTTADKLTREATMSSQWRLSRAIEYVNAHLSESISLAELARSAGLTRMRFTSEFRRATGMRPHEYLLRRRIEHAQHLLLKSGPNVIEVALSCGFRSQAHFTTVFKRLVGETPCCWTMKASAERQAKLSVPGLNQDVLAMVRWSVVRDWSSATAQ
jgi:AraC family transcriptional regulator